MMLSCRGKENFGKKKSFTPYTDPGQIHTYHYNICKRIYEKSFSEQIETKTCKWEIAKAYKSEILSHLLFKN